MSGRLAAFILVSGIVFFVLSGRAEGFGMAAARGLLLVALLPTPLLLVYVVLAPFFKPGWPSASGAKLLGLAILITWGLVLVGFRIDDRRAAETMEQGDELVRLIEEYREETGSYPPSLAVLAADDGVLPEPALVGSSFHYAPGEGGYRLGFPSVSFLYCNYLHEAGEWYCDD